jgi:endonuclease/exonuclease/phosphatase family metal-dependent hydrolase
MLSKRKIILIIAKCALLLPLCFLIYIVASLAHATITDYAPPEITELTIDGHSTQRIISNPNLTFLSWNIGFAGLGAKSNFYYDSNHSFFFTDGKMVRVPESYVSENLMGIRNFLDNHRTDFILLQEVDKRSKRSYFKDHDALFLEDLKDYSHSFSLNYQVGRVIIPALQPWNAYGMVESGLSSYSKYKPGTSTRYQYPGKYDWPDYLFHLDRCMSVQRYQTTQKMGKELVVINTHNSAYDNGKLKSKEMAYLKDFLLREYQEGNYVIVGGDWNQSPPKVSYEEVSRAGGVAPISLNHPTNITTDFMPKDWKWAYDKTVPTCRSVADTLDYGVTPVSLIDFYLVSPNIEIVSVEGKNLKFEHSDHNPVLMTLRLSDFETK